MLILSAFTFLIAYFQKMDGEQRTLMENFRVSLKKSHDENAITSYGTLNDKIVHDGSVPAKEKVLVSASGYTHWAVPQIEKGTPQEQLDSSDYGYVYSHEDTENDPLRKYYYYAYGDSQREHELSPDSDVSRVDRDYTSTFQRTVSQNYGNNEPPDINGTSNETMQYNLIGASTISQSRNTTATFKKKSVGGAQ